MIRGTLARRSTWAAILTIGITPWVYFSLGSGGMGVESAQSSGGRSSSFSCGACATSASDGVSGDVTSTTPQTTLPAETTTTTPIPAVGSAASVPSAATSTSPSSASPPTIPPLATPETNNPISGVQDGSQVASPTTSTQPTPVVDLPRICPSGLLHLAVTSTSISPSSTSPNDWNVAMQGTFTNISTIVIVVRWMQVSMVDSMGNFVGYLDLYPDNEEITRPGQTFTASGSNYYPVHSSSEPVIGSIGSLWAQVGWVTTCL